ncbi:alpha/beta hydrolase [soil metagenome]
MSDNFFISLRNDAGQGQPGIEVGPAAYIQFGADDPSYNLNARIDPQKWLDAIPGTNILVFVHGFGNLAGDVVSRHKSIKGNLPGGVTLVSFDWPSGDKTFMAYQHDKNNAKLTAANLMTDCLQLLLKKFKPANIHLFAHSMGAYVTENAFQSSQPLKINHVLMAAADVDRKNYQAGSALLANFLGKCADLTAYVSADDQALQESEKLPINKGAVPLGLKGFPDATVPGACWGIECTKYYEAFPSQFDPKPVPPGEFSHVWYILYKPVPPPRNDFYVDMGTALQGLSKAPTRATTSDPRAFVLQRP